MFFMIIMQTFIAFAKKVQKMVPRWAPLSLGRDVAQKSHYVN